MTAFRFRFFASGKTAKAPLPALLRAIDVLEFGNSRIRVYFLRPRTRAPTGLQFGEGSSRQIVTAVFLHQHVVFDTDAAVRP